MPIAIIAKHKHLDPAGLTAATTFEQLGIDSLDAADLLFKFEDEFSLSKKFDKPGLLAMANAGPGTNGSQFFITVTPTPWLNNKHTIFGEVVSGQALADRLANVIPKDGGDRPKTEVVIKKLTISKTP